MLPALDRCSVILSRFAGIAKFQGKDDTVGFSSQQIHHIIDIVASLHLVLSKILIQVVDELDLFTEFSTWLRYEIDRLASDSSSSPNEEVNEKEASIKHNKVLLYLQTAMTNSPLFVFFGDAAEDHEEDWSQLQPGTRIFDQVDQQLQKYEQGLPYLEQLPRVDFLCKVLGQEASTVFSHIAEAEKRNVLFGRPHVVGVPQNDTPMDMRMCKMVGIAILQIVINTS
jgi:anaphase-promoting complex subunit 4